MSAKNKLLTFILVILVLFFVTGVFMARANPNFQPLVQEAKVNVDKLNLKIINEALQRYYLDQNTYPEKLETLVPEYLDEVPDVQQLGKKLEYRNQDSGYILVID